MLRFIGALEESKDQLWIVPDLTGYRATHNRSFWLRSDSQTITHALNRTFKTSSFRHFAVRPDLVDHTRRRLVEHAKTMIDKLFEHRLVATVPADQHNFVISFTKDPAKELPSSFSMATYDASFMIQRPDYAATLPTDIKHLFCSSKGPDDTFALSQFVSCIIKLKGFA